MKKKKNRAIYFATQAKEKYNYYQHSEIGYNYRIDKLSASIGLNELNNIEQYILKRRKVNFFYRELFDNIKGIKVFEELNDNYFSNHWFSCITIDENITKYSVTNLYEQLIKDNIEVRRLWKPMHLQPVFKKYDYYGGEISENLFNKGLCLPSGSNLTALDKGRIKETIHKIL